MVLEQRNGLNKLGSGRSGTVLDLRALRASVLDDGVKGIPGGVVPFPLSEIGRQNWNVLRDDLPLPLLVMKASALEHNIAVMRDFLNEGDGRISFAPHGKTHMSPQLANMQLAAGAWGITAATVNQIQVYRRFGVARIFMANQLLGRQHVRYVVGELNRDLDFDFYCLVDSVDGVRILAAHAREFKLKRPIKVLLEGGWSGGRTGCRSLEAARAVLEAVRGARDVVAIAGVEGYEGTIAAHNDDEQELRDKVNTYLGFLLSLLETIEPADMPGASEIIFSAGGSAHFDLVTDAAARARSFLPIRTVLRSGCYLTHDAGMYQHYQEQRARRGYKGEFRPALEVWSYVQSLPEPGLAILSMGKRDCPYDCDLPFPQELYRGIRKRELAKCRIIALNDQHAYMTYESGAELKVGDRIVCGISHPCTAFDKWRFIPVVNDDYDVVDGLLTFF